MRELESGTAETLWESMPVISVGPLHRQPYTTSGQSSEFERFGEAHLLINNLLRPCLDNPSW